MVDIHADRMLIIDFGSQYTQLIARRIREAGVYCELRGHTVSDDEIRHFAPKGIILSGGPASVTDTASLTAPDAVFALGVPVLGICYGMQTMAVQLDGEVRASNDREFGYAELRVVADTPLLTGIVDRAAPDGGSLLDVWMSHGDQVMTLPPGFRAVATTATCAIAAMADDQRHWYGVQFHPEVTHTPQGKRLLARFVHDICGCAATWTADNIITDAITRLRAQIGDARVILGLSGGVDSSVVGALLHEAIGEQLTCVFVDNGLLRLGEGDAVMATFAEHMGVNVIRVNAEARFLDALSGISDPEEKRKTIGAMFVTIFEETAATIDDARFLAQGTIYPDVIESAGHAGGAAKVIKSHHNVGGLPATMRLQLVEPLRELFKDEVRRVGIELGLPAAMVQRHPFPGPGLGVRILGEVSKAAADTLRQADAIFIETLRAYDWYDRVSQAFAVFLPIKSVGVTGDYRHYAHVIALRAVETTDFMTARWAQLPYALLDEASHRIINSVSGVARVVYDISGKPPATIEWE